MSKGNLKHLKNLMLLADSSDKWEDELRNLCVRLTKAAPVSDLVLIAERLHEIGQRLDRETAERN